MLRLKDFEGDAHFDPEVMRLLDLTTASPHPDMADDAEHQWGAEVIVTHRRTAGGWRGGSTIWSAAAAITR